MMDRRDQARPRCRDKVVTVGKAIQPKGLHDRVAPADGDQAYIFMAS